MTKGLKSISISPDIMSSNGSANELLASMMPLSPGDWIGEDFERDWQMEKGSSDQAGTEGVYTFEIKGPSD